MVQLEQTSSLQEKLPSLETKGIYDGKFIDRSQAITPVCTVYLQAYTYMIYYTLYCVGYCSYLYVAIYHWR